MEAEKAVYRSRQKKEATAPSGGMLEWAAPPAKIGELDFFFVSSMIFHNSNKV